MKRVYVFSAVLLLLFVSLSGCATKAATYKFVEEGDNTATIAFSRGNPGVSFLEYNELTLPPAEGGTYWDSLLFSSGVPLQIKVQAYYEQQQTRVIGGGLIGAIANVASAVATVSRSVNKDVIFECPQLQAGGQYRLSFRKGNGTPGKNTLVLTDIAAKQVVYEQDFE
jgi:hypothetical protein